MMEGSLSIVKCNWIAEYFRRQPIAKCEKCYKKDLKPNDQTKCRNGHTFCLKCTQKMAEQQIGNLSTTFPCMASKGCNAGFSDEEIENVLSFPKCQKWKNIQLTKLYKDLQIEFESCPFCLFKYAVEVIKGENEIFICKNQSCAIRSCRICKAKEHGLQNCKGANESSTSSYDQDRSKYIFEIPKGKGYEHRCPCCDFLIDEAYAEWDEYCPQCGNRNCFGCMCSMHYCLCGQTE